MKRGSLLILVAFLLLIVGIVSFYSINLTTKPRMSSEISLLFLGDYMIGDAYSGPAHIPFHNISPLFENQDEIIANLETAITTKTNPIHPEKQYSYSMDPSVLMELETQNITLFCHANNHVYDYDEEGLIETQQYLDTYSFSFFGAGVNESQARKGCIIQYNDVTVGYLGYFEYRTSYDTLYRYYAKGNTSGVAILNTTNLAEDILRMKNQADIVIVSMHIGDNYDINISADHRFFAQFAIDQGADAVLSHSAHIPLPIELYKNKPICYSLGNFIFTTPGRFDLVNEMYHAGLSVKLQISNKKIVTLCVTPIQTNNKETKFQPTILSEEKAAHLFSTILPKNGIIEYIGSTAILYI